MEELTDLGSAIAFLEEIGAVRIQHSGFSLLTHLVGTHKLLTDWGGDSDVCLAGLFHSVYGTESFKSAVLPPELRHKVQDAIGKPAEKLAYCFGAMEKNSLYANLERNEGFHIIDRFENRRRDLTGAELASIFNMVLANWLEQRDRTPEEYRFIRRREFMAMRPFLLTKAREALDAAYGFAAM